MLISITAAVAAFVVSLAGAVSSATTTVSGTSVVSGGTVVSAATMGSGTTFYASPTGTGTACTQASPCSLTTAVANATPGSTVQAAPGTYTGGVLVTKPIALVGQGATLDAATSADGYGIELVAPGASGAIVDGWTVKNAQFSGILAGSHIANANGTPATSGSAISGVVIENVTVTGNDRGFSGVVGQGAGECFSTPFAPGDCGEGIHLVSATGSVVENSTVSGNAGGILVTDEFGSSAADVIRGNTVTNNVDDCGITIASHSASQIHGLVIQGNTVDGNGVRGQGAGILMAGAGPGTGVHDNVVTGNEASGNGLAGVVIHDHFPGDFDNNVITANRLSDNNLTGDTDFFAAQDPATTDILVAAGGPSPTAPPVAAIRGTVIAGNDLSNASIGIWTLNVQSPVIAGNRFAGVTTEVSAH